MNTLIDENIYVPSKSKIITFNINQQWCQIIAPHRVKNVNSLNWCSTWMEATFKWMCPNSHYECLDMVPCCVFCRKQLLLVQKKSCCETWWDFSFIQYLDCKVITLGFCYFPFSLHCLSPEWIYVVPYSAHITIFVKIMNSLNFEFPIISKLWKFVLKCFLIPFTYPTGSALPPLKSLTVARKSSERSGKKRLEYWKGQGGMATSLIHTTY